LNTAPLPSTRNQTFSFFFYFARYRWGGDGKNNNDNNTVHHTSANTYTRNKAQLSDGEKNVQQRQQKSQTKANKKKKFFGRKK